MIVRPSVLEDNRCVLTQLRPTERGFVEVVRESCCVAIPRGLASETGPTGLSENRAQGGSVLRWYDALLGQSSDSLAQAKKS